MVATPSLGRARSLAGERQYRRLFAGALLSTVGDAVYFVAATWLAYDLTGSTAVSGLAGALTQAPEVFRAFVGPFVDRWSLRRLLVAAELAQGVVVLSVPVAAALGVLDVRIVLAVMPALALVGQFAGPAQSATLPRVVDDDLLVPANAAFQFARQGVQTAARGAAGALVALAGAVTLYVVDAVTFVLGAACFATLSLPARTSDEGDEGDDSTYLADLRAGVAVVARTRLRYLVGVATVSRAFLSASLAVLPAYASALGGPGTYGTVLAALAAGGLLGSLAASHVDGIPLGRLAAVAFGVTASLWYAAALATAPLVGAVLFGAAWVPVGVYNVLVPSVLQSGVPSDQLGRVTATAGSLAGVAAPLGMLGGGALGTAVGASRVLVATGVGFAGVAAAWVAVPSLRSFPAATAIEDGAFAS